MAPVKPLGVDQKGRVDSNPKTRPGVTGFVQEYNQEGPKPSDLNPAVVTEDSVLPTPQTRRAVVKGPKAKAAKKSRR
jgi:hypothetical protein